MTGQNGKATYHVGDLPSSRVEIQSAASERPGGSSWLVKMTRHHPVRCIAVLCISVIVLSAAITCIVVFGINRNSADVTTATVTTSKCLSIDSFGQFFLKEGKDVVVLLGKLFV